MLYLLITIIIQNGTTTTFFDKEPSLKACKEARTEALKYDNEVTKVDAYCIKREK